MRVKNSKILLYVMLDLWSGGGSKCDNREFYLSPTSWGGFSCIPDGNHGPTRNTVSLVNRKERNLH